MNGAACRGIVLAAVLLCPFALALDAEEAAFLDIINQYRWANGLPALALSPTLTQASELHSQDMADHDYFSHYSLDGRTPYDRMVQAGYNYATYMGENIAAGYVTAAEVFQGWKNSPGHDANMLYPGFTVIGIGRAYNASSYYRWYWTTDFGGYDDSGTPLPPAVAITSTTHPSQDLWYANADPTFEWDVVPDAEGYSFLIDRAPSTIPDASIDSTASSTAYSNLQDGIWYFHVRVKTAAGWGPPSHYRIKVDRTPPDPPAITSGTHPDQDMQYPNGDPSFSWSPPFDTSGIFGYSYVLDRQALTTPDELIDTHSTHKSYYDLGEGLWYFHVRCVDRAGNWGSTSHFRAAVRFRPAANFDAAPTTGYEPLSVTFTDLSISRTGITNWSWDFGDGYSSHEQNPVHLYLHEGVYSVSLMVLESDGDYDSISKTDYICVIRPLKLTARLSLEFSPQTPRAGEPVTVWGSLEPWEPEAYITITLQPPGYPAVNYTISVGSLGEFSFEYIPPFAGVWHVRALWQGNSSSANQSVEIPVGKGFAHITCIVEPTLSHYGEPIRLSGTAGPVAVPFTVEHRVSGGPWLPLGQPSWTSELSYELWFLPPQAGSYEFRAVWPGDENFLEFETYLAAHCVLKADTSITCAVNTTSAVYGSWVEVSGAISPARSFPVKIGYYKESAWRDIAALTVGEDGSFRYSWQVDVVGLVYVASLWEGDQNHNGAMSELIQLSSGKAVTILSCLVEPQVATVNESITIRGRARPVLAAIVDIRVESPRGFHHRTQAHVGVSGEFALDFVPQEAGTWKVMVELQGNPYFEPATCEAEFLVVTSRVDLECHVWPSALALGERVHIAGYSSSVSGPILLQYAHAGGGWTNLDWVECSPDGRYGCSWLPPHAGRYEFRAVWMAGERFLECASQPVEAYVSKGSSSISVAVSEALPVYGSRVTVSGEICPPLAAQVAVERFASGEWNQVAIVPSTQDGRYTYVMQVDFIGEMKIRSCWLGNNDWYGASSEALTMKSEQAHILVSCYAEPGFIEPNQSVAIYGEIRPPLSVPIVVDAISPEGTELRYHVTTDPAGRYMLTLTLSKVGAWYVVAACDGNDPYGHSVSQGTWILVAEDIVEATRASLLSLLGACLAIKVLGLSSCPGPHIGDDPPRHVQHNGRCNPTATQTRPPFASCGSRPKS